MPERLNWRRAVGYGVLWGIAREAMSAFALPLSQISAMELLIFEAHTLPHACLAGVVLAGATMLLERRLTLALIAPALVAFSLLFADRYSLSAPSVGVDVPSWLHNPSNLHTIWGNMFCGGLFVAAYRLSAQSERTRGLLAQAEIARQQTEALLSAAQLQGLQGHVDPAFLLRVMAEVERRYGHDAAGAGRLLDALVSFLRAAMPGVRSGASTLAAEMLLCTQYAKVWAELEPGRATWSIHVDGALPELPFPALLLLPVLDRLAAADGSASRAELHVRHSTAQCTLSMERAVFGHSRWMPPDLLYRLQVGLRTLFGDAWTLALGDSPATPAFALTLLLDRPARSGLPLFSTHEETTHG